MPGGTSQGKLLINGNNLREESVYQISKLEGLDYLNPLISDMKLKDLEFDLLGIGLVFV